MRTEHPPDERLWTALFRIHEPRGSALGLAGAPRSSLALPGADIDKVTLPANLEQLVPADPGAHRR
jgi:hypothetical protein